MSIDGIHEEKKGFFTRGYPGKMKKREKKGISPRGRREDDAGGHDHARKKAMVRKDGKMNLRKFYNYDPDEIEEEYDEES